MSSDWLIDTPHSVPELSDVDVWKWNAEDVVTTAAAVLTSEERMRAERGLTPAIRQRALASRAGLRLLLASYLKLPADALQFSLNPHGKPELSRGCPPLWFNVSHSAETVVVAIAGVPVGIDLEFERPLRDLAGLMRRISTPAQFADWQLLPGAEQAASFFSTWTIKEAVAKLDGRGIQLALNQIELASRNRLVRATWSDDTADGSTNGAAEVQTLSLPERGHLAVATAMQQVTLRYRQLDVGKMRF